MSSISPISLNFSSLAAKHAVRGARAVDHLTSGSRISRPGDDPAGLAVSLELANRSNLRSVAARNINYGVSISQIASGTLQVAGEVTGRLQELATQAANGTLNDSQRGVLNQEYQALKQELDRMGQATEFNAEKIFGNSFGVQTGTGSDGQSVSYLSLPELSAEALGLNGDISTQENARAQVDALSAAQNNLAQSQSKSGAFLSALETTLATHQAIGLEEQAAAARIADADIAEEVAANTSSQISGQIGVALQAHAAASLEQSAQVLLV